MDRFFGKLKKKTGGGRKKTVTDKSHQPPEETSSPPRSLSVEPKDGISVKASIWHPNEGQPREAFETTLRPPVTRSGDRHSNYRPHRRAPEAPPWSTLTAQSPLEFSSHPYESTKKSYPAPWTSKATEISPSTSRRKELPKKEKLPKNEKLPKYEKTPEVHQTPAASEVNVHGVIQVESESELESDSEPEPEPDSSTRNTSQEIEDLFLALESPRLDSKTSIISPTKSERTAQLLAEKYAHLVHQNAELHARKYMRIINHRAELESRGILWPTNPPTDEYLNDEKEPEIYEFPKFAPKPLRLRNQREPQGDGLRSNQRQISANGAVHDYQAAKLESWRQFYGKGEMMQTFHREMDEYLGAIMFQRLLKETTAAARRLSTVYRSEITVRNYWDGVRAFLGLEIKNEDAMN